MSVKVKETTYPDLFDYLANLWLKSHIKHAVSFIQHQVGAAAQISLTTLQEVNETTWGSDADLNTLNKNKRNPVNFDTSEQSTH